MGMGRGATAGIPEDKGGGLRKRVSGEMKKLFLVGRMDCSMQFSVINIRVTYSTSLPAYHVLMFTRGLCLI